MHGSPGLLPLQERARAELVRAQLKNASLGTGRDGREEGEFLAKLLVARRQVRYQLVVRVQVLQAGFSTIASLRKYDALTSEFLILWVVLS